MEKRKVEVRSTMNDNVVVSFAHEDTGTNIVTAGYNKICNLLGINRVIAEQRYYVVEG